MSDSYLKKSIALKWHQDQSICFFCPGKKNTETVLKEIFRIERFWQRREVVIKLLMIAFNFPPLNTAGTHRSMRFAKYLSGPNRKVVVLTGEAPVEKEGGAGVNLPEGLTVFRARVHDWASWIHRIKGNRKGKRSGRMTTPSASRVRGPVPYQKPTVWQNIKDAISLLLTFPDSKVGWIPRAVMTGLKVIREEGIDVLYTSGPPHSSHLIGLVLKWMTQKPWIADFRDPWARQRWLKDCEKQPWRVKAIERLEKVVVKEANHVILNTGPMLESFWKQYPGQSEEKFSCIPNGFDPEQFSGIAIKRRVGPFRLTHAGRLYRKRNPLVLLKGVQGLFNKGFLREEDIELEFMGTVALEGFSLEQAVEDLGLQRITKIIPYLPHRECLEKLFEADVLMVIQPEADVQIPGKIFEYLVVGKPILALAHPGATADFVLKNHLGWVANPDEVEEVERGIFELFQNKVQGNDDFKIESNLLDDHNSKSLTMKLDKIMETCVAGRKP